MDNVKALSIFYFLYFAVMALPFFYEEQISAADVVFTLNEDSSKHVVQVLRMKIGEQLNLTNGRGDILTCEIIDDHRKRGEVKIIDRKVVAAGQKKKIIAISPLKNSSRFEWFLEKATEIGIDEIIPIICERTEKSQLKMERLKGILVSAMLQSQQAWLPLLHEGITFNEYLKNIAPQKGIQKFIAHCEEEEKAHLASQLLDETSLILIGPEGDFSSREIELALQAEFKPVSLGDSRLRTETAGMVAAVLLKTKKL